MLPSAITLLLPVWGHRFTARFLEFGLPTLLAPGNVPALAAQLPCKFVILTSADDEEYFRTNATFNRLSDVCETEIRFIDHFITDGNHSTTITLAYAEAVRAAGAAMHEKCFFFLVADYIFADGSLASVLARMMRGASAVQVGNFQIVQEDALPWLQEQLLGSAGSLALPARKMMEWSLHHLHPTTVANMVNMPLNHNSHTNRLFWRVDGRTILGRFYLMHMICIRPETSNFVISSSCDYSFVEEMCPSGNVDVITDSDEYLVVEMQSRNHEENFLRAGPLKTRALAKSLAGWTTAGHRKNANYSLLFHANDIPNEMPASIAAADQFVGEVERALKDKPHPHRNHPYWGGALAAYKESTGKKIDAAEVQAAFGIPVSNPVIRYLLWQAQRVLLGIPPHIYPCHPFWPDMHVVLKELESFLLNPAAKLLLVANSPTVFTILLADNGERVHRVSANRLLLAPVDRYASFANRFDLCLLELNEGEMANGDDLVDRIVPLLKTGSPILVVVRNVRGLKNAVAFLTGVAYHSSRLVRPETALVAIRYIPASRVRWLAHRLLLRWRGLATRSPVIGLLVAASVGWLPLALCAIGNLAAGRRGSETMRTGISSSVIIKFRAEPGRQDDRHQYSREESGKRRARALLNARAQRRAALIGEMSSETPAIQDPAATPAAIDTNDAPLLADGDVTRVGLPQSIAGLKDPHRYPADPGLLRARYLFVKNLVEGRDLIAEVGCNFEFGTRAVLQTADRATVYDQDPAVIAKIRAKEDGCGSIRTCVHDILEGPLPLQHDALFSLDLLDHLTPSEIETVVTNLRASVRRRGLLIIGTSMAPGSSRPREEPIGRKLEFESFLQRHFDGVISFSMFEGPEPPYRSTVQPGYNSMASYLFKVCVVA